MGGQGQILQGLFLWNGASRSHMQEADGDKMKMWSYLKLISFSKRLMKKERRKKKAVSRDKRGRNKFP